MLCVQIPKGNDILSCTDDDARLYIGTSQLDGLKVLFTDIATGRKTLMDATVDGDEWYVTEPPLISGHTYRAQLVVNEITPVTFYPYVLDQTTYGTSYVADDTQYRGVNFSVVKGYYPEGDTYFGQDQWLSL